VSELRFTREDAASRYTLHDGADLVCVLDYRDDGDSVSMTRTFTVPPFRGQGYAARLVEHAVADLERRGDRTVVPMCWFVEEWFQQHPDRAGILQPRSAASAAPTSPAADDSPSPA
jgi:predicted GNAT family acetyltransferase